jgi:cytidylate kinase
VVVASAKIRDNRRYTQNKRKSSENYKKMRNNKKFKQNQDKNVKTTYKAGAF